MTQVYTSLPPVTDEERAAIVASARTSHAHAQLMDSIPAMTGLQAGGQGTKQRLPASFRAAAWNVERCLFPEKSAAHVAEHSPDVILLSEMDDGMARTAQRDTTAVMAQSLRMHHVFGVEFFELDLGGETERKYCTHDVNFKGWHGNAILSSVPFEALALFRLDVDGHWFAANGAVPTDPNQPRIGGRMAVAAILPGETGPVCVAATHLESNSGVQNRAQEFMRLLDEIDAFAPGLPVLVGGDLNTGNHVPPDFDWRQETLFDLARERGYSFDLTADGHTTRASLITPHQTRRMKLDWFCSRGMTGAPRPVLPSLDPDGTALSDHECILCDVSHYAAV